MTERARKHFARLVLILSLASLTSLLVAGPAAAAVKWTAKASWGDTNLPPGGNAQMVLLAGNAGDTPSSGTVTMKDSLPGGVTVSSFEVPGGGWTCFGVGTATATCQSTMSVRSFYSGSQAGGPSYLPRVLVNLTVLPTASGTKPNCLSVSGGGAAAAIVPPAPCAATPVSAYDADAIEIGSMPARFGFVPNSFDADLFDAPMPSGQVVRTAGDHPFELRVNFDFNEMHGTDPREGTPYTNPVGRVRTVETILPRGLIGNPEATPKCDPVVFSRVAGLTRTECPANTQVGYIHLELSEGAGQGGFGGATLGVDNFARVPVYNLVPPKGVPADFGFNVFVTQNHIYPALDAGHGYAIKALTPYITDLAAVRSVRFVMWGVPGDPAHDSLRADPKDPFGFGVPFEGQIKPLLTLPMDCGVENGPFLNRADSWNKPGEFTPTLSSTGEVVDASTRKFSHEENPVNVEGCDDPRIRFEPKVRLQPTSRAAGGPTGLSVHLEVPQRDNTVDEPAKLYAQNGNVHGIHTPPMKKAVITFPKGMTLSTSAAQGLDGCSAAEIGLGTDSPVTCPESSRYGGLTLHTPILPEDAPMVGDIFIGKQYDNPFNNFLTLYFVIHDTDRGLLVKLPGKGELDPKTGQLTTTFDDLPQFPVSDFELSIKGGVRAGLVNPPTCGSKQIKAEFFSWAEPERPLTRTSSYDVTQKPDGSPCPNSLAERQFKPDFSAGTVNPNAGSYSPFVFRLQRTDDDQEFSQLTTTLPPGLLANISNLSECPDAAIAQAQAPGRTGTAEKLFPSCPASSQLGTTDVGSGVGEVITYVPGKAYLAGPYLGEPLSLVVITPILAGPYDLGVITVRSAIHVNGERGQATISTDPFPQIYEGIPVRIRDVRVKADTPDTIINPTSCDPMKVTAHVTGTGGDLDSTADDTAVDLADRFQAANCGSLPFKPRLTFRLEGGTRRGQFPAFSALLRARPGDANIARSTVVLPASEFIEQGHIRTVCTRPQYAADQCPAGSIYGRAKAKSPLFNEVLEGPVYLRSNGGERVLPDLVVKLNGKIDVNLAGFVDSVKGRVRNTFDVIPDAPVTYFSLQMQGGKKGLLVNRRNLCTAPSRASVKLTGQNGKAHDTHPKVAVDCAKGKARHNRKNKPGRGASR